MVSRKQIVAHIKEYGVLGTTRTAEITGKLTVPWGETLVFKLFHQQQLGNCFNGVLNILFL